MVPALVAGYFFITQNSGNDLANVQAKSKSKWQKLLEKKEIDRSYWENYLPYIRHKEYDKALKKYERNQVNTANASFDSQALTNSGLVYPLHKNITTTYFWAGEDASGDNYGISNNSSCWDESWDKHCKNENQFYFALPYNDFDDNGNRKAEAFNVIPWASEKKWSDSESMCKNRWIKITHDDKVAYAQWEDAGPCDDAGGCGENDKNYVFGTAAPKFKVGLDVSPAVKNQLGLKDVDQTNWQFVDEKDVPDGPWKQVITTSGVYWK